MELAIYLFIVIFMLTFTHIFLSFCINLSPYFFTCEQAIIMMSALSSSRIHRARINSYGMFQVLPYQSSEMKSVVEV